MPPSSRLHKYILLHALLVLMVLAQTLSLGHRIFHGHSAAEQTESVSATETKQSSLTVLLSALFSHSTNAGCDAWDAAYAPDSLTSSDPAPTIPAVSADRVFSPPAYPSPGSPFLGFALARAPPQNQLSI
ncbi:MAG: hypothetical protein JNM52_10315 [Betaproteobacteria bacterium]|nr:hypothetical protein [Betaproteobacteria bacterium]